MIYAFSIGYNLSWMNNSFKINTQKGKKITTLKKKIQLKRSIFKMKSIVIIPVQDLLTAFLGQHVKTIN